MKIISFVTILSTLLFSINPIAAELTTVDKYEEAVSLVKEADQKLFVMFTSSTCKHCNDAKKDFIDNPQIFGDDIVCFVSYEDRKDLFKKFKIKSLPTMILFEGSIETKRTEGYTGKNNFIKWYK